MLHRPWPKSARLGIRGGLAVLTLAAVLLPMQTRPQQPNPPPATASSPLIASPPAANQPPEPLPVAPDVIPSAIATYDLDQFGKFMQKHQIEITRACDLATTNILHELEALGQKYPL